MKTFATALSLAMALSAIGFSAHAAADFISKETLAVPGAKPAETLAASVADVQAIFEKYKPAVDSGSRIVRPLTVGGTKSNPVVRVSIEKCVLFICETVDLDALVSIRPGATKNCEKAYALTADLRRSSPRLATTYDQLQVAICLKKSGGKSVIEVSSQAHQGPSYEEGFVQREIFSMLRLQISPINKAISATMRENAR